MENISLTLPDVVIGRLRDQVARGVRLCEDDAASEALRQMVEARYRAKVEAFHEALALGIAQLDRGEARSIPMSSFGKTMKSWTEPHERTADCPLVGSACQAA